MVPEDAVSESPYPIAKYEHMERRRNSSVCGASGAPPAMTSYSLPPSTADIFLKMIVSHRPPAVLGLRPEFSSEVLPREASLKSRLESLEALILAMARVYTRSKTRGTPAM